MEKRDCVDNDELVALGCRLGDQQSIHLAMGILGGVSDDLAVGQGRKRHFRHGFENGKERERLGIVQKILIYRENRLEKLGFAKENTRNVNEVIYIPLACQTRLFINNVIVYQSVVR